MTTPSTQPQQTPQTQPTQTAAEAEAQWFQQLQRLVFAGPADPDDQALQSALDALRDQMLALRREG